MNSDGDRMNDQSKVPESPGYDFEASAADAQRQAEDLIRQAQIRAEPKPAPLPDVGRPRHVGDERA